MKKHKRDRYKPGYASLAREVLKDALRCGVDMHTLDTSIWAQYLLWHVKTMQGKGAVKHGIGVEQQ